MNQFAAVLVGKLASAAPLRKGGAGVAAIVAVFVLLVISVSAFTVSGPQAAERSLGGFDFAGSDSLALADDLDLGVLREVRHAAERAGATDVGLRIASSTVAVDGLTGQFSTGASRFVRYLEPQRDPDLALPDTVAPHTGRLAVRPDEVAISDALARELGQPSTISVFAGLKTLRVTGVYTPKFANDAWQVLAGPGLWSSLPVDGIRSGFPQADGSLEVFWKGPTDPADVLSAVTTANPATVGIDSMITSLVTRSDLMVGNRPLTQRAPLMFVLPGLVMTCLATVLLVNLSRRRLIGVRQRLGDTGADDRLVMVAILASTCLVVTLSVVAGAVLGVVAGWAVRIALLPHLLTQPMSAIPGLGPLVLRLWLVAMLTALAVVALRVRAPRPQIGIKPGPRRFPWPTIRRAAALVAAVWSLQPLLSASDLDSVSRAALPLVTAVLLIVPDGFRLVVRGIPTHRSEWLSARRLIESDRARYSGAVVALAFSLAVPTILATLYATQWRAEDERNVSTVPAGQVHVSTGYLLDAEKVRNVVAELRSATDLPDPVMIGRAESVYLRSPNQFGAFGLWVVRDAKQLEAVLGQAWTQPAGDVLNAGGVVSWAGAAPPLVDDSRGVELRTGPATNLDVDPGIASSVGGAILAETARGLGIPVLADQLAVYTGVTDAARQEALAAVQAAGFTSKAIQYHTEPTPTEFPPIWGVALVGLLLAMFSILWLVLHGQAKHLREYAARLLAVGLDQRWSRRVLAIASLTVAATGVVTGMLAGVVVIGVFAKYASRGWYTLVIPYQYVALVVGAVALFTAMSIHLGLRSLQVQALRTD